MLKSSRHKPSRCRPRERGDPVDTESPIVDLCIAENFCPGILGPRVRGDDSGESLLHILESGNPGAENAAKDWVPAFAGTSGARGDSNCSHLTLVLIVPH